MARSMLTAVLIVSGMTAAVTAPLRAQERALHGLADFWAPKFDHEPFGQALIEQLPANATFIDDAGAGELAPDDFSGLRLTERALAEIASYDPKIEQRPEGACIAPTVAFYMQAPFPMEIYEGRDLIIFKMEYYDLYRIIFLDGRQHPPADAPRSKSGHSVGRWEGETLVVDTTHVSPGTFMNNGFNHSEDIRIVERMRLSPDKTTLWITQVYEDPETFEGLASRYMAFTRTPGEYVYPFECDPGYLLD
jgi:hypothetical protein